MVTELTQDHIGWWARIDMHYATNYEPSVRIPRAEFLKGGWIVISPTLVSHLIHIG